MLQRLTNSWELAKASGRVLLADTELLVFPLLSGAALLAVSASFFVPAALFGARVANLAEGVIGPLGFVVLFLFYFVQYFVIIFFNSALVGAAMIRLDGGAPTLGDGLRIAWSRVRPILAYAAIAATVGMLLRAARKRSGLLTRLVVGALGIAWSLATFLVVPVLVSRDLGPLEAVRESARILKRTWGEQIAGSLGIGFVFGLLTFGLVIGGIPLMVLAVSSGMLAVIVTAAVFLGLSLLALTLIQSALTGIYQAALYRFATTGDAGWGFDNRLLQGAFTK